MEVIMQKKHIKAGRRTAICAVSAALLFSSMNLEIFATEANDLPSAGVDFFLSASATSVNLGFMENIKNKDNIINITIRKTDVNCSDTKFLTISTSEVQR